MHLSYCLREHAVRASLFLGFCCCFAMMADQESSFGQESETPAAAKIEIRDEPSVIDPSALVHPRLAEKATVDFTTGTLKDLYRWLQTEQKLSLSVDASALKDSDILPSDALGDRLQDEPLYLLLDRLSCLGIGWSMNGDDLILTTRFEADQQYFTVSYNLGEFLDEGYNGNDLLEMITESSGGLWISNGDEEGDIVLLGDVVFVRQTERVQREVRALLQALKSPARRTLMLDPPQHAVLRGLLDNRLSLTLDEVPLSDAVAELARVSHARIRLSPVHLEKASVSERAPISVEMTDQKLRTVLDSLLSAYKLAWIIEDGVIKVVDKATAESTTRAAVYDVRDLCRDANESRALMFALMAQCGNPWTDNGDEIGNICFARPGVMVVRHTNRMHDTILNLLENYRTALRGSKPRKPSGPDPAEILTYYYRIPSRMAEQLETQLPQLVRPGSWKSDQNPTEPGTIGLFSSTDSLLDAHGNPVVGPKTNAADAGQALVVQNSVLMITHRREVHREIDAFLQKLMHGDRPVPEGFGGSGGLGGGGAGGGNFGGGGFGGGYFSISETARENTPDRNP